MSIIITFDDTSINIKYIDDEESHYQLNIPNNDINKKLIENTVFKFEKCGGVIIMHDDVHVFQLSKMECKYSDYIKMQNKLENTEKELDDIKKDNNLLKQEMVDFKNELLQQMKNNMVDFKNDLLQQMKNEMVNLKNELFVSNNLLQKQIEKVNDKSVEDKNDLQQQLKLSIHQFNKDINLPFVFMVNLDIRDSMRIYYDNDEKLLFYRRSGCNYCSGLIALLQKIVIIKEPLICAIRCDYQRIVIPPGKVSIELNVYLKIYNKGIHDNIKTGEIIILINEKDIDNILALCKKHQMIQNLSITHVLSKCLKE
jgi:hypothetical protein